MNRTMDLNADLGESYGAWSMGDDEAMLDVVTSANIACGFHAGDPVTIRRTCESAARRGVAIGAHPSYPDLVGFGRREMAMSRDELEAAVLVQLGALDACCRAAGARMSYVKPHGALYHRVAHDPEHASALVGAMRAYDEGLALLVAGGVVADLARATGLRVFTEAFADRAYGQDGLLVPRSQPGSVITDPELIASRVVLLARDQTVIAVDGTRVRVAADSICVHGDTPGTVELARVARAALESAGIEVRALA